MNPYRNGDTPKVGDRVMFDPENPLHLRRRPRGSLGTIYELGTNLIDPVESIVYVNWDTELPWPDDDCFVFLLNKVTN